MDIHQYEIGPERAERGQSLFRIRGNLDLVPFFAQEAGNQLQSDCSVVTTRIVSLAIDKGPPQICHQGEDRTYKLI